MSLLNLSYFDSSHVRLYFCLRRSTAGDLFTRAAECATAAMKGRTANKYYALAEEAWASVEEE